MEELQGSMIASKDLLKDPLVLKCFPKGFRRDIIRQVLADETLMRLEPAKIAEMALEELVALGSTYQVKDGLSEDDEEEPEETSPEEPLIPEEEAELYSDIPEEVPESVTVLVDKGGSAARIILNRPLEEIKGPSEFEIREALAGRGVVKGILDEYIRRLAARPVYGRRFKVAEGQPAIDGVDGEVVFHFDVSNDLTPEVTEDGIADYRSLSYVKNVEEGELLCEIVPPTSGIRGFNVFGEVLEGREGVSVQVRGGDNTVVSKDGKKITAACEGQVRLRGNSIIVSRVLRLAQVDTSTGNILFAGTVQVDGDVANGFTVHAGGDIIIKGIAENAKLVSGGNIVLCGGMKGMDNGILDAAGNIRTLFIENAKVRVRGNLYADVVLNSTVECGQAVRLGGKSGFLIGGECTAAQTVYAYQIGNEANVATNIFLKDVEAFSIHQAKLSKELAKQRGNLKRLLQVAELTVANGGDDGVCMMFARLVVLKRRLEEHVDRLKKELAELVGPASDRRVIAREVLFPNASLEIDGAVYRNKIVQYCCCARSVKGRIEFIAYFD